MSLHRLPPKTSKPLYSSNVREKSKSGSSRSARTINFSQFNSHLSPSLGFTLLEIMVVFSTLVLLGGFGFASFVSYSRNQAVEQAAHQFKTAIEQAKFSAISRVRPSTLVCPHPISDYHVHPCYLGGCAGLPDTGPTGRRWFEVDIEQRPAGGAPSECQILTRKQFPPNVQFSETASHYTCGGAGNLIGFTSLTATLHTNWITSDEEDEETDEGSEFPSPACRVVIRGFNNTISRTVCVCSSGSVSVQKGISTCPAPIC